MSTIILDPTDERTPIRRQLADRPAAVTGTVVLLDVGAARGNLTRATHE